MVLPKSKNTVGLGNSLMNDRFGKGKGSDRKKVSAVGAAGRKGVARTGQDGETYITNTSKEASWVKMRSVTEQAALDEFLSTAELAGTDFTAERTNSSVKIVHVGKKNPYLLDANGERAAMRKHQKNKGRLTVPRRPPWDEKTTPKQLDIQERESLLEWRRGLAELQENEDLLMTPFERNIEVWRQLWRVIERSDLVVQIVDARNPLLLRSEDLEKYVKEVDASKNNLLLVNKADMMTLKQRRMWADYFMEKGIAYTFFSAHLAKEDQDGDVVSSGGSSVEDELGEAHDTAAETDLLAEKAQKVQIQDRQDEEAEWSSEEDLDGSDSAISSSSKEDASTRILTVDELESLFLEKAPNTSTTKTTIGLVGYPNVGKSSTINALIGAKKVSVSATPGKTKHFQTIHLSDEVILCDCPGLVFPNFATTKADLVCDGVLPIDQLREFTGPVALVVQRIPQSFMEAIYGIKIHTQLVEEGGTGRLTASELLSTYAKARGFTTTGHGPPDESRAARYILKDYVKGKLLYCHPPPARHPAQGSGDDEVMIADGTQFNRELYDFTHLPAKRQAWLRDHHYDTSIGITSPNDDDNDDDDDELTQENIESDSITTTTTSKPAPPKQEAPGPRHKQLDTRFFGPGSGNKTTTAHLKLPFNQSLQQHQQSQHQQHDDQSQDPADQARRELTGRKKRIMLALEKNVDPAEVMVKSKKHFKGGKRKGGGGGGAKAVGFT